MSEIKEQSVVKPSEVALEAYKAILASKQEATKEYSKQYYEYNESQNELKRRIAELKKLKKTLDDQKAKNEPLWNNVFREKETLIEKAKNEYVQLVAKEAAEGASRMLDSVADSMGVLRVHVAVPQMIIPEMPVLPR